jgi:CBS domain-containing protein
MAQHGVRKICGSGSFPGAAVSEMPGEPGLKRGAESMLVKDIMSSSVKTVTPSTKLVEVASLMCLYRYSGLPVLENGKLVGLIAEKDVLHRLFPSLEDLMEGMASIDMDKMMGQYKDVLSLRVGDVMTRNLVTVSPDMHVLRAATVMVRHKFRRIPVAEGDHLVGMLSLGDVHKAIFHSNISHNLTMG